MLLITFALLNYITLQKGEEKASYEYVPHLERCAEEKECTEVTKCAQIRHSPICTYALQLIVVNYGHHLKT